MHNKEKIKKKNKRKIEPKKEKEKQEENNWKPGKTVKTLEEKS